MNNAERKDSFYEHHPVDDIEPEQEVDSSSAAKNFCWELIHMLDESKNVRLSLHCFALIFSGRDTETGEALTMKQLASKWGISKAAVSKRCIQICDKLNLPRPQHMRQEKTKISFQLSNRRNTSHAN